MKPSTDIDPAGIACVTFDLDDTLWHCAPVIEAAERLLHEWLSETCPAFAERVPFEDFIAARGAHFAANPQWHHDMSALRRDFLHGLLRETGCDPALVEPAFALFLEARQAVCLHEGVEDTLRCLGHRFRLGVVTNGNADVRRIGIGHLFDFVVTTAEVGRPKPDAAVYRAVLARVGLPAGQVLHVGDDPERDVLGAARAGLRTAWVNARGTGWPRQDCRPDAEIRSVTELPALLGVEQAS